MVAAHKKYLYIAYFLCVENLSLFFFKYVLVQCVATERSRIKLITTTIIWNSENTLKSRLISQYINRYSKKNMITFAYN